MRLSYFVKESGTNLRRNLLMTLAATLTAAVSLLLLGGVMTLGDFVGGVTSQIEKGIEVQVFLKDDITKDQQDEIHQTLRKIQLVRKVTYTSKKEAFEEFKDLYRDQPALWQNIGEDTLPASFSVGLTNPKRVDVVKSRLEDNPAIFQIVDQRETVQQIVRFTSLLRTFSAVMITILFIAAVLLISNTIQLGIFARRKEIEIMKLVGATNWFVRLPYMLEGVAQGVLGAAVALILLSIGKWGVRQVIPPLIPTSVLTGVDFGQILWLVLLGVSIGAIGSTVALRRYLEV